MVSGGRLTFLEANLSALIGSIIGSVAAYCVGYYGGRPLILKYGNRFFLSKDHFFKAESVFNKYGKAAVFFGRLLPVVRTFISLPAGLSKMKPLHFLFYSVIGIIPWNMLLIYLGFRFGNSYDTVIRPLFKQYEYVVLALIIIVLLYFIIKHVLKKSRVEKD
jgi:membrane protein DedA with SNARE-associated domain